MRVKIAALLLLTFGCASAPRVSSLSTDEKIGQMFAPSAKGGYMSETSADYQRLARLVRDEHVTGVVWFTANVYETALMNKRLQSLARIPLLTFADLEAGMGMRFADTWYWPPAMAVAATGDPSLAEREGRQVAKEALTVGINQILAPVADVNVNADNPVINTRSYGEDPREVGKYVAAFTRGVRSQGVLATAKHFPGHGDTHTDSHRAVPVLRVDQARLDEVELVPFKAAIDAGVDSVMIGHLSLPAIDPEQVPPLPEGFVPENVYSSTKEEWSADFTMPATISRPIIEGLLRKHLDFHGVIVTDAFDMGAMTARFGAGEAAVRAIEAGEDLILMPANIDVAMKAVKEAVASGRIPMSRIDASVQRILDAKARIARTPIDPDTIFRVVDSKESRALASEIAEKAITVVRAEPGALPLPRDKRVTVVVISDFAELSNPLTEIERELRRRMTTTPRVVMLDPRSSDAEIATVVDAAKDAEVVLLAFAVRTRSGSGTVALPEPGKKAIEQISAGNARVVAVSFGNPYLLREVPSLPTYVCAYGPQPPLQLAAMRALFGEAPVRGKLPVTIPGVAPRGTGIELTPPAAASRPR